MVLPPTLLVECPPFEVSPSSSLEDIILTHADNMAKARVCKLRHGALVDLLNDREREK